MAPFSTTLGVKGKPQRKGSHSWRKNIDISTIDSNLQTLRTEERLTGGIIATKPNEELFFIDKKSLPTSLLPGKPKLHYETVLIPDSKIMVPLSKATPKIQTATCTSLHELKKVKNLVKVIKSKPEAVPHKIEIGNLWSSSNELKPKATDSNRRTIPIKDKAISIHPGASYRPTQGDYQEALNKAVNLENSRLEKDRIKHFVPIESTNFVQVNNSSSDHIEENPENIAVDDPIISPIDDQDQPELPIKPSKRKSKSQRNKAIKEKAKQESQKKIKANKILLNHLDSLKSSLIRTKKEMEYLAEVSDLKRQNAKRRNATLTKKLSPLTFEPPMFPVQLAEDMSDSVRNVKIEGSLLMDRFKTLQKRNLIEVRVPVKASRRLRVRHIERHSYKDFK